MTASCSEIVERDDPRLYTTALFAPKPVRERLMVLYAFDCELSRAVRASAESLIPRMRLQWWRDVLSEAAAGAPPKAHEVAAPLTVLISGYPSLADELSALIDHHGQLLELPWSQTVYDAWRNGRYGARTRAAALLVEVPPSTPIPDTTALADAFILRHAHRMAASGGQVLIPGLLSSDLAALSRGVHTDTTNAACREVAEQGLESLRAARITPTPAGLVPVLLPILWGERTLTLVARDSAAIFGQINDIERPFDGLRLAWRALRGRW